MFCLKLRASVLLNVITLIFLVGVDVVVDGRPLDLLSIDFNKPIDDDDSEDDSTNNDDDDDDDSSDSDGVG